MAVLVDAHLLEDLGFLCRDHPCLQVGELALQGRSLASQVDAHRLRLDLKRLALPLQFSDVEGTEPVHLHAEAGDLGVGAVEVLSGLSGVLAGPEQRNLRGVGGGGLWGQGRPGSARRGGWCGSRLLLRLLVRRGAVVGPLLAVPVPYLRGVFRVRVPAGGRSSAHGGVSPLDGSLDASSTVAATADIASD